MRAGVKVTGAGSVQARLRYAANTIPDHARRVMNQAAEKIVKLAKILVPEDTTALRESIRIEKVRSTSGRLAINIIVGEKMVEMEDGRVIDLNDYALIIHENYSSMNPGERTLEKMRRYPQYVIGEGFLTRAAEKNEPTMMNDLNQEVFKTIKAIFQGATGE